MTALTATSRAPAAYRPPPTPGKEARGPVSSSTTSGELRVKARQWAPDPYAVPRGPWLVQGGATCATHSAKGVPVLLVQPLARAPHLSSPCLLTVPAS